ncbi:MAG: DUF4419 domain-containing protein [Myxococcales bacterium]|nr:DUF4419 domain-containing protein [Myxococcales bacterium]
MRAGTHEGFTFAVDDVAPATERLAEGDGAIEAIVGQPLLVSSRTRPLVDTPVVREALTRGEHGLLVAVHTAFSDHRPLVLSPDTIWLTLAQGFALHLREHAEALRDRYVRHAGRKTVQVDTFDFTSVAAWETHLAAFHAGLAAELGKGVTELVSRPFSTTGPTEQAVSRVVLMDAFQRYFDYELYCICGIPEITLRGTPDDWRDVRARVRALADHDLGWWVADLEPLCDQWVATAEGRPDREFWQSMLQARGDLRDAPGDGLVDPAVSLPERGRTLRAQRVPARRARPRGAARLPGAVPALEGARSAHGPTGRLVPRGDLHGADPGRAVAGHRAPPGGVGIGGSTWWPGSSASGKWRASSRSNRASSGRCARRPASASGTRSRRASLPVQRWWRRNPSRLHIPPCWRSCSIASAHGSYSTVVCCSSRGPSSRTCGCGPPMVSSFPWTASASPSSRTARSSRSSRSVAGRAGGRWSTCRRADRTSRRGSPSSRARWASSSTSWRTWASSTSSTQGPRSTARWPTSGSHDPARPGENQRMGRPADPRCGVSWVVHRCPSQARRRGAFDWLRLPYTHDGSIRFATRRRAPLGRAARPDPGRCRMPRCLRGVLQR